MDQLERVEEAIRAEPLPDWVDHVVVREMFDADEKPALDVLLVISDDQVDVVNDGAQLAEAAHLIHQAIRSAAVDLWPYTRFMSVSELAA